MGDIRKLSQSTLAYESLDIAGALIHSELVGEYNTNNPLGID